MSGRELHALLARRLRSGARGIALSTREEARAQRLVEGLADTLAWPLSVWSAGSGVDGGGRHLELAQLLAHLESLHERGLWLLLGAAGPSLRDRELRRLRELVQRRGPGPTLIFVDPPSRHTAALAEAIPELACERLPLPDRDDLLALLGELGLALAAAGEQGLRAELDDAASRVAHAALGLELLEVERIVREGVAEVGAGAAALAAFVGEQKAARLDRHGLLELIAAAPADELGGLERLKEWLSLRGLALEPAAREAGIPAPKGLLLLGVQGCGKSLAARVCASVLHLPLLRLEPGRLFGGTVGESEANLRLALETAERMAPIVLWIDEVDKGLAGSEGAASDGGTTARVVGGLLTWLQERAHEVFVVATANGIERLPPELLRRGRLDELFFVDLPDADARASILRIHLELRARRLLGATPPLASPWEAFAALARAAEGFSGAELEAALTEARLAAYAQRRPLAAADLERAIAATIPLSRSHGELIEGLRAWASTRARPA